MFNIFKKNEETESKLKNLSTSVQELSEKELNKVNGGGNGGDGTITGDVDTNMVKTHSNTNNN